MFSCSSSLTVVVGVLMDVNTTVAVVVCWTVGFKAAEVVLSLFSFSVVAVLWTVCTELAVGVVAGCSNVVSRTNEDVSVAADCGVCVPD
uniref:Uncharacterized protein n=1 Tax=Ditylenchus dipsaci TaxID=166011 RepID=A0A915E049_9BILA